ncbi:MAG: SEC-C domain-containing protein [Deltaproteobacteria bacterium]|nr:SEC-C domain-containing protein [Deltaproteobacteria bacterium]
MNQQREVIYKQRREALMGKSLKSSIEDMISEKTEEIADMFADEKALPEDWDIKGLNEAVFKQFNFRLNPFDEDTLDGLNREGLAQLIYEAAMEIYNDREVAVGEEDFRQLERVVMLQTVDNLWKDHLLSMDHLKEGIGLRGYAQQNPLLIYKKEGFELFQEMISRVKEETLGILFRIQIAESEKIDDLRKPKEQNLTFSSGDAPARKKPVKRVEKKIGRNAPCPCGSGKKYKKCCGR